MRADRLISILMLLQTHGRTTAQQLADELEVSERTIYRDIDALSLSGIPIYAECGPGGGYDLLDSYRADLLGLNEQELRALLLISIPHPLRELGVGQNIKGALLKLSAAISNVNKNDASQINRKIHLDSSPWSVSYEQVPCLQILHQALIQERLVNIHYRGDFGTVLETTIAPLGMVSKANIWYLICEQKEHKRVIRMSTIMDAQILPENYYFPANFDLPSFWQEWCEITESMKPRFPVKLSVSAVLFEWIRFKHGSLSRVVEMDKTAANCNGWINISMTFESFEEARTNILGFGRSAEVLEPLSLRTSVIDFARQVTVVYESEDILS